MRLLKWISLGLGALVGLAVIGVLVVVWFVDPNSFKSRIESAVRDATGRELTLVGDIELGFFPWLALRAGEGRYANPPGFGTEPMISWQSAQLGARLFPLLRGELVADRVVLRGADIRLVRRRDGVANWEHPRGNNNDESPPSEPMAIRIAGVRIEDSRVSFVDETPEGRTLEVSALDFSTDEIEPGEPLTDTKMSGVLHGTDLAPEGVAFSVDIPQLLAPADFSALQVNNFELSFGGLEVEGEVRGDLGAQPRLTGKIATNVFDLRGLLASVGVAAPATTDPDALRQAQLSGAWSFAAGAMSIEPLDLRLDDTRFSGHLRVGGDGVPGEFALRGDRLDFARYIPPPDPASEPFVLPTAALKALKFRGRVELDRATLDEVLMKGVSLRLILDERGLRADQPVSTR